MASTTILGDTGSKTTTTAPLTVSLHLISLGLAGYNPSLQAFAAEQLQDEDGDKSSFFQWWYFGICCGCLAGVSVMSYIQDTFGWGLGFSIPTLSMLASVLILLSANRFYLYTADSKPIAALQCHKSAIVQLHELEEEKLVFQNHEEGEEVEKNRSKKQRINVVYQTGRLVIRLFPVWTLLLTFAVIFQQPATFFTKQGMTTARNIGPNFKIPPAALQSAITVSIILLTPIYDRCFVPLARAFTGNDKGVTVRQRMGIGMLVSVVAMAVAAVTACKQRAEAAEMSIIWLLPQYILLGVSDIFTVVGMQEFFYSEVPATMRTLGIALNTSVFGCGSFFGSFLISLLEHFTGGDGHGWFSDDMREARLDKYYWFLAGLSSLSLVVFVIFCKFDRVCN